jgi:hypothetical protein
MKDHAEVRWHFLKAMVVASAVLAISLSSGAQAQQARPLAHPYAITADTVMSVSLTGDLHDLNDPFDLALGVWSDPISLKGKGVYRVKVIQKTTDVNPGFDHAFTIVLADANKKELGRMDLGDCASGTFGEYGIQAYITSSAFSNALFHRRRDPTPAAVPGGNVLPADTLMQVSLRGNLYDPPESVELTLGAWSDPIQLKGSGTYRVKLVQKTDAEAAWGPVFMFILADIDGKEFGRFGLGNSATGTYPSIGVQAFIAMANRDHNRDPAYFSHASPN